MNHWYRYFPLFFVENNLLATIFSFYNYLSVASSSLSTRVVGFPFYYVVIFILIDK